MNTQNGEEQIVFEPHYHTITNTGRRVSDAMAEYVDNAIQACKSSEKCKIHISMHLHNDKMNTKSFITIMDNGCGMDKDGLQIFATYSLDQETRNNRPEGKDRSFISKFGVGVKQAGFFLGDKIKVLTKVKHDPAVREFLLSKEEFAKRSENNENVYGGTIQLRSKGNMQYMSPDEAKVGKMIDSIRTHENEHDQFTIFVIRMNEDIIRRMFRSRSFEKVPSELAEIYHFHLHPEHKADRIMEYFKNRAKAGASSNSSSSSSSQSSSTVAPMFVPYTTFIDGRALCDPMDLTHMANPVNSCVAAARDCFLFTMEIPDPSPENGAVTAEMMNLTQSATFTGVGTEEKRKVECIMLYFPFQDGKETVPTVEAPEQTGANTSSNSAVIDLTDPVLVDVPTINIFWQDRLVSESTLQNLSVAFPNANTVGKCETLKLPRNWKGRVHGYLFFDWTFRHISNNKLKLQVDPNLETWINSKAVMDKCITRPKNTRAEMLKWLQTCHVKLDKEFVFSSRAAHGVGAKPNCTYFSELDYGNGKHVLKTDGRVKFRVKGSAAQSSKVLAKIVDFEVKEQLAKDEVRHHGGGNLRYQRLPVEIFGEEVETEPVTSIDFSSRGEFEVKQKEVDELLARSPATMNMYLFELNHDEKVLLENAELIAGVEYYKIGFQLVNHKGEVVVGRPDTPGHRYTVASSLTGAATSDLWEYNKEGKDTKVVGNGKKKFENCYFSFFDIKFRRAGPVEFTSRASDRDRDLLEQVVEVVVSSKHAEKFAFANKPRDTLNLGDFFPPFSLQFLDEMDNVVDFTGRVKLKLTSPQMDVALRKGNNDAMVYKITNNGVLEVEDDPWTPTPFADAELLSADRVVDSVDVHFLLEVVAPRFGVDGVEVFDQKLGEPLEVVIRIFAGKPKQWKLLDTDLTGDFTVRNGELLEPGVLRFGCFDNWGNRVAPPKGHVWSLELEDGQISEQGGAPSGSSQRNGGGRTVTQSGEAYLCNLKAQSDGFVPAEGEHVQASVGINSSHPQDDIDGDFSPYVLRVHITPTCTPTNLQMYRNGEAFDDRLILRAGDSVENLSFRILDENDSPIDLDEDWRNTKVATVTTSWWEAPKKKKQTIAKDFKLPPITNIPTEVDNLPITCQLSLSFFSQMFIVCFDLVILPAEPSQWAVLLKSDLQDGIMVSEGPEELRSKIMGVCLTDRFGNRIEEDLRAANGPVPLLTVRSLVDEDQDGEDDAASEAGNNNHLEPVSGDDEENSENASSKSPKRKRTQGSSSSSASSRKEKRTRKSADSNVFRELSLVRGSVPVDDDSTAKTSSKASKVAVIGNRRMLKSGANEEDEDEDDEPIIKVFRCWILAPDASLVGFSLNADAQLTISDVNNTVAALQKIVRLTPGLPRQVALSSKTLGMLEPQSIHRVEVATFTTRIADLVVHCWDSDGNLSSMTGLASNLDTVFSASGNKKLRQVKGKANTFEAGPIQVDFANMSRLVGVEEEEGETARQSLVDADSNAVLIQCNVSYKLNGQLVTMLPATLVCTVKQFNTVSDVVLSNIPSTTSSSSSSRATLSPADILSRRGRLFCDEQGVYSLGVFSGDDLPAIDITMRTDDEQPYTPPVEDMMVDIKRRGVATGNISAKNKKKSRVTAGLEAAPVMSITSLYSVVAVTDRGCLQLRPVPRNGTSDEEVEALFESAAAGEAAGGNPATKLCGEFELVVTYFENRPTMSTVPIELKKRTVTVILTISPGAIAHLRPDKESMVRLASVAVCDSRAPKNRFVCKSLGFHLHDRYNNLCEFPNDSTVVCSLRSVAAEEESASETSMEIEQSPAPLLEGADENGRLLGGFENDGRVCHFGEMFIEYSGGKRGIRDGEYLLHFQLADISGSSSNAQPANPVVYSVLVNYTSDEQRQTLIETTKAEQKPLLETKYRHAELQEEVRNVSAEIARIYKENAGMPTLKDYSKDANALLQVIERRHQQLGEMQACVSQARAAKKTAGYPNPLLTAGLETIGLVVDKLFVQDEAEAFILSWAAIGLINALIVPNTVIAKEIYKKKDNNIKVWSLDQMQKFKPRGADGQPKPRSEEFVKRRQLPFPPVKARGNPRYLANMVQLNPCDEHLRDSVVNTLFGTTLLFDDLDSATDYRQSLIAKDLKPPILFTVTGDKIAANGVLDPRGGRKPARLEYIFGEQLPSASGDCDKLRFELEVLQRLSDQLALRNSRQVELQTIDIGAVERALEKIDEDLRGFGVNFTQA